MSTSCCTCTRLCPRRGGVENIDEREGGSGEGRFRVYDFGFLFPFINNNFSLFSRYRTRRVMIISARLPLQKKSALVVSQSYSIQVYMVCLFVFFCLLLSLALPSSFERVSFSPPPLTLSFLFTDSAPEKPSSSSSSSSSPYSSVNFLFFFVWYTACWMGVWQPRGPQGAPKK